MIATLLLLAGMSSATATIRLPTSWLCWYDSATAVACRLFNAADAPDDAHSSGSPPRHPTLPPLVDAILDRPATLRERRVSIPLFTEPQDMEFVRELAEAVMCGVRNDCSVHFTTSPAELALLLDELEDPALN